MGEQLVNWYETFTSRSIDRDSRPFWWAIVSVRLWALKSWTRYAVQQGLVPTDFGEWAADLEAARKRAFDDLAEAGL